MSNPEKKNEEEVFLQSTDDDELSGVAGGTSDDDPPSWWDKDIYNCVKNNARNIYGGKGFPNCAATVEEGSWCGTNDACVRQAISYYDLTECGKAWK